MRLPVSPRLQRNQIVAGAAVLLLALAIWPWLAPTAAPRRSADLDTPAPSAAIAALPPLATFAGVFERPLFSPSRRPPAEAKASALGPGIAERYRLIGLVAAGATRRALLAEGKRRFEIAEGSALDGWTIARIERLIHLQLPDHGAPGCVVVGTRRVVVV